MILLNKKQKVEEEITIEDEIHSVTPKKKAGSTVTPVEEAVEITPKESLQSRAMKFLKPALTPVPTTVTSRPAATTVTTTSIPTSSSVTTSTSIPTSPPPPYVPLSVAAGSMQPLPLPTVAATANASTGTINLLPATEKPVMR